MGSYIITSLSALYKHGIISFNPRRIFIEMPFGTNVSNYSNKYAISTQNKKTISIGVIEIDKQKYYCIERLFIELDKFPLENTIYSEAIKNFSWKANPANVVRIYNKIKNKRRGLNKERIEGFIKKHFVDIEYFLKLETNKDKELVLKEYISYLLSKINIPLFLDPKNKTFMLFCDPKEIIDDIYFDKSDLTINQIIKILKDKNNDIYFEIVNQKDILKSASIKNSKDTFLLLKPKSLKRNIEFKTILESIGSIKLSLCCNYSQKELYEIIDDFKVTKTQLKTINAHALIFTKEMLAAEKYQSLISKNKDSTRTKDLVDLYFLMVEDTNFQYEKFYKWFFRKWLNSSRDSKNQNEVIDFIRVHKDIELTKIKNHFDKAKEMYDVEISYEECLNIYKKISETILERFKKYIADN